MEDNNLLLNEGFLRDLSEATIIFSPLPGSSKKNIVIEDFENFNKYNVTTIIIICRPQAGRHLRLRILLERYV